MVLDDAWSRECDGQVQASAAASSRRQVAQMADARVILPPVPTHRYLGLAT
jgi:hypothetical protein